MAAALSSLAAFGAACAPLARPAGLLCETRRTLPEASPRPAPSFSSPPFLSAWETSVGGRPGQTRKPRPGALQAARQTFSSFEEMLAEEDVVLVDFYATWCGPCQLMAGVLQEVAAQRKDLAKIVKIDTEKYPRLASAYQVQALPTMILFRKGRPIYRMEGAMSSTDLIATVEGALASA